MCYLDIRLRLFEPLLWNKNEIEDLKRQSCQVCFVTPERCTNISRIFARRHIKEGYYSMGFLPTGSCNASIKQMENSKNFLALRYNATSPFFLNGDWAIESSGKYMVDGISFTYVTSSQASVEKASEESIHFTTQLQQRIEACLNSQANENKGVQIKYTLPPAKNDNDTELTEQTTTPTPTTTNCGTTSKPEDDHYDTEGNSNLEENEAFVERMADTHFQEHGNRPSWIDDLKRMMKNWKKRLESLERQQTANKKEMIKEDKAIRKELNQGEVIHSLF